MVRRLAVVLLLALSFHGYAADEKSADDNSGEHSGGAPRGPRTESESKSAADKLEQEAFLETHFPISKAFAEGYRLNIFGRGTELAKADYLAGQEVAELLLSGEDKDEKAWTDRLTEIGKAADAAIEKIEKEKKDDNLTAEQEAAARFYKKIKWGIGFELSGAKTFTDKASKEFQAGYENGRGDKKKAGEAYQKAKKDLANEKLTATDREGILEELKKNNRLDRAALLGYGGAKYWKGKSSFTAPGDALRMAAVADADGRLFVTLTDPESKKPVAYYVGNRQTNVDGAASALAQQMSSWSDNNKARAWDQTPLEKVEKFAAYKSGEKGPALEEKKREEFTKLAFTPPTASLSFASTPKASDVPTLVAALNKQQGACFDCHGKTAKIPLKFEGNSPATFKVTGKVGETDTTYNLTQLADRLKTMGAVSTSHPKLSDLVRAWAAAQ